jgi:hypothetical protein
MRVLDGAVVRERSILAPRADYREFQLEVNESFEHRFH